MFNQPEIFSWKNNTERNISCCVVDIDTCTSLKEGHEYTTTEKPFSNLYLNDVIKR